MKTLCAMLVVQASVIAACGQGRVNFSNTPTTFTDGIDRSVYVCSGTEITKLTGTNYVAALYFSEGTSPLTSFAVRSLEDQSLASAVAHFREVSQDSPLAGTWSGGLRMLPGTEVGQVVNLQVRVWDFDLYANYESAVAAAGTYLQSDVFSYAIPADGDTAGLRLTGLRASFILCVPEPSTLVLAGIGLASLGIWRRLKRRTEPT